MGDSEIFEVLVFLIVYGPLVLYLWLALPSPVLGPSVLLGLLWWERRSVRLGKAGSNVKSDDEAIGDIQTEPEADIAGPRVELSFRHVGVIVWKAGRLIGYGAMLIGFMWPLVLSFAVVPHRHVSESGPELVGWIPVPFVAMLTLYVMWRVFGPGAVVDASRAGFVDGARVADFRRILT